MQVTPKDTAIKPFSTRVSWIVDTPTWIQREKEGKNLPQPSKEKSVWEKKTSLLKSESGRSKVEEEEYEEAEEEEEEEEYEEEEREEGEEEG